MISTVTLNPAIDKTIRIAKLVPNDTNRVVSVETDAGGKGINGARMLKALGADVTAVTFLGGTPGDYIRMVLEREEIEVNAVTTSKPTRVCIGVEEGAGLPPTTFNERGGPVEHRELVELLERVKNISRESSFVILGGSIPLGVNPDVYNVLIQIAKAGGAKVILDADGEALEQGLVAKPFMIKPNREEAERLVGKDFESKADAARAALKLSERGIELVVISLGKQGLIACYEGMIYDIVPPEIKVQSTIGSGDSLVAGIVCALDSGKDIVEALKLGCAAGSATAMSSGAEIGKIEDVEALVAQVKVSRVEPEPLK